jgi:hypothetical protein
MELNLNVELILVKQRARVELEHPRARCVGGVGLVSGLSTERTLAIAAASVRSAEVRRGVHFEIPCAIRIVDQRFVASVGRQLDRGVRDVIGRAPRVTDRSPDQCGLIGVRVGLIDDQFNGALIGYQLGLIGDDRRRCLMSHRQHHHRCCRYNPRSLHINFHNQLITSFG